MTNIIDTIANTRELSILSNAIKITSIEKIIDDSCDFTIFAPNNMAFAQLSKINLNILTEDIWRLTEILSIHIVSGKLDYRELLKMCSDTNRQVTLMSIDSSPIQIDLSDGIRLGSSTVLSTDTSARNGIVHLIDRVMMPA
jgi:transforming growth factor-beta-induced protein